MGQCQDQGLNCEGTVHSSYASIPHPDFPSCSVIVRYDFKECTDAASGTPVFEYVVTGVELPALDPNNPTTDPCWPLYALYNQMHQGAKRDFARDLLAEVMPEVAKVSFMIKYNEAKNAALSDPNNFQKQLDYQSFLCASGGVKVYRAVQASCINIFVTDNCPPVNSGIESDDKGGATPMTANGDPQLPPCRWYRYTPCVEGGPCCIETMELCFVEDPLIIGQEPYIQVTNRTVTQTGTMGVAECEAATSPHSPLPGEVELGCAVYCNNDLPDPTINTEENLSLIRSDSASVVEQGDLEVSR